MGHIETSSDNLNEAKKRKKWSYGAVLVVLELMLYLCLTIILILTIIGVCAKSLQSCQTFCYPIDCSPQGFSVHGIFQARILETVVMPSSRASSQPRD